MQKINPFLWFDHEAEEAARFYTSIFPDSKIKNVSRYGADGPGVPGSVMTVAFQIHGQDFIALNGGPQFQFTPAISFLVHCETQEEVDTLWEKLLDGGAAEQCGWLRDRYGVSWQIVPTVLGAMLGDKDPEKAKRVAAAMFEMRKLDIAALKRAHERA